MDDQQQGIQEPILGNLKLRKTTIIARQILLSFVDLNRLIIPIFDKAKIYRVPFYYYDKFRSKDKQRFSKELYRLKQAGFIKKYIDGKEKFIELTDKGKKQIKSYLSQNIDIESPKKWDRKWRIVMYDIPILKKNRRDILRFRLESLGFLKLQESVYVYPFDCYKEINLVTSIYFIEPCVQYVVAERIQSEINLIKKFLDRGILKNSML